MPLRYTLALTSRSKYFERDVKARDGHNSFAGLRIRRKIQDTQHMKSYSFVHHITIALITVVLGLNHLPATAQSSTTPPTPQEQRRLQREQERLRTGNAIIETQRLSLALYGISSKDIQDAVIAFSVARAMAREELHERRLKLQNGVRSRIPAAEQLVLLREYREAARKVATVDDEALRALDAKIGYSQNPHLQSSLVLLGVLGDEKAITDGPLGLGAFGSGYFVPTPSTRPTTSR